MGKAQNVFRCSECGASERKWLGRCPSCGNWNTLVEERELEERKSARGRGGPRKASRAKPITQVAGEEAPRRALGIGGGAAESHPDPGRRRFPSDAELMAP